MKTKAVSGMMLTLLLIDMYLVLLLSMFVVIPIQSHEEPQYVDLSYLVSHLEDFKGIVIMTNGTAIRRTEYHYGGFFLEAPDGTGIKVSLGGLPNQGLPANLTVVVVVGWVYYSSMLHEWIFVAESWWLQYADWITVKDLLVEMSIENTTTPLGEELSILMVAPEGGTCPDTRIFDVYLYDSNYSLFSYWSQDKGAYFVVTYVDPGYKETLRWDLHRIEGGECFPPPPGSYYLVGAIMTGWDGILPTELTPPILIRIDNSTITPIGKTWTVDDDDVRADFHTIQEAINAASPGDTIYVYNGIYHEHVIVNETVSLIGENKHDTIVDGNGRLAVFTVTANNVSISGFTIRNMWRGVVLCSSGNVVAGNIITNATGIAGQGIFSGFRTSSNEISRNVVSNCWMGVWFEFSDLCTVNNNTIINNSFGIEVENIVVTVPEAPLPPLSTYYNFITIAGNTISNNTVGISLHNSGMNTIYHNKLFNNEVGLSLRHNSSINIIYHNNIIDNRKQVCLYQSYNNTWDDGYPSGGNYWSDHVCTGNPSDGSQPYIIDANNIDHYPFQDPSGWLPPPLVDVFEVVWDGEVFNVAIESNSTVSDFEFRKDQKEISFSVTGPDGTVGFCNVTIPMDLMKGEPWLILVNGAPATYIQSNNGTHTFLYFTYTHSLHNIIIRGTWVVPEFPTWTPMLLILILLSIVIAIYKRRLLKTPIH